MIEFKCYRPGVCVCVCVCMCVCVCVCVRVLLTGPRVGQRDPLSDDPKVNSIREQFQHQVQVTSSQSLRERAAAGAKRPTAGADEVVAVVVVVVVVVVVQMSEHQVGRHDNGGLRRRGFSLR